MTPSLRSFTPVLAFALSCGLLAACVDEPDAPALELELEPGTGKNDGSCPGVAASIAPRAASPFSCSGVSARTAALGADANAFWGSEVQLCACGADYEQQYGSCYGAFSQFGLGYIYVGDEFMRKLAAATGNDSIPLAYVIGHEFGHEVQARTGLDGTLQFLELGADCMAGYYLGSLACRGGVTEHGLIQTLATACALADGTGDPVRDRETHGTCEQRVAAVATGLAAYRERKPVVAACGN